ncbi:CrcB family protein [Sporolactobacillus shoreicorticis]|uniref:Fluoride-specific ion channel FluC n=1 Tax=Sporolactobacillus shoreicorticis TaxID=1923877 RepID=A0ABW5RZS0_9BACL|nr:CrcB family protein [Sporolactobacillus shoreicorticis]MCO7127247.1 CrcB family protein [Sporolactobacillus shoreicorticis]
MLANYLAVALGALFGVLARVLLSNWIKKKWTVTFPLATFIVNISGSLALGILTGLSLGPRLSLLFGTGLIGTYTTFSTFNLENSKLIRRKKGTVFLIYCGGSYLFGIAAIFFGCSLGKMMRIMIGL